MFIYAFRAGQGSNFMDRQKDLRPTFFIPIYSPFIFVCMVHQVSPQPTFFNTAFTACF